MKKFVFYLIALGLAFAVVNVIYILMLTLFDWDFSKAKEAYSFRHRHLENIVLGNSTALDGVNSEILSQCCGSTYNFSLGGASLESSYRQLREYLKYNDKPKRVLLFLSSCHINYNRIQELNPIVDYYYSETTNSGLSGLPLFKFRWLFVENAKKLMSSDHRNAKIVEGQLQINKIVRDPGSDNENACAILESSYRTAGYAYLDSISYLCQRNNVVLVAFEMPCWKQFRNACGDLKLHMDQRAVPLFNLNNDSMCEAILSPTDWLSENHLNYQGSVHLTNHIRTLLRTDSIH
jgi:hypothetical protein